MSELTWKYVKTLGDRHAVGAFLEENNLSLPEDLIACLKNNNGGRPNRKTFDTDRSKEHMIKTLLSFNRGDAETVYTAFTTLRKEYQKFDLVPFASDPFGNFICYDDSRGDIVLWLHETNQTEKISDSFTDFLNMLYE